MRIIAGKMRSRKLLTLDGLATRPTLDQTKEAIFSSLGGYVNNYNVLDVFGGSGALSFEAISRGATSSVIIDNNIDAINIIRKNAKALKVEKQVFIYHGSYQNILEQLKTHQFDLVFLDPPFRMKVIDTLCRFLMDHNMIASGGFIVCEYPKEDVVCKDYINYRVKLCRRYASSEILILEKEN